MAMYRIALVTLFVAGCSKADAPPAPTVGWIEASTAKPLEATLAEQAQLAVKAGKKPHAYLHASWCGPCNAIEKTRHSDAQMKAAFAGTHIIAIDVDKMPPDQLAAAKLKSDVIPIFFRLDGAGHATGDSIDGGAWGDNVPANMAPPLTAYFSK